MEPNSYFVYYEGDFLREEEAKIPISDRGFLFGDGAYATIQVREGIPLFLDTHLERLHDQCLSFHLKMPPFDRSSIFELIGRNGANKGIWRLKIFITGGDTTEVRLPERSGRVLMTLNHLADSVSRQPLKMGLFPYPFSLCHAHFKSLAHLNRLFVTQEAYTQKMDDCLTLTEKGYVLEAAYGNIFWIADGVFYTPDPALPIHFGVTIGHAISLAQELGYSVQKVRTPYRELPPHGIYFRTSSLGGICPIIQVGEQKFSLNDGIARAFREGYERLVLEQQELMLTF